MTLPYQVLQSSKPVLPDLIVCPPNVQDAEINCTMTTATRRIIFCWLPSGHFRRLQINLSAVQVLENKNREEKNREEKNREEKNREEKNREEKNREWNKGK